MTESRSVFSGRRKEFLSIPKTSNFRTTCQEMALRLVFATLEVVTASFVRTSLLPGWYYFQIKALKSPPAPPEMMICHQQHNNHYVTTRTTKNVTDKEEKHTKNHVCVPFCSEMNEALIIIVSPSFCSEQSFSKQHSPSGVKWVGVLPPFHVAPFHEMALIFFQSSAKIRF